MVRFIFDLDGTLTTCETLPVISDHFALQEKIADLTRLTVQGNIPFIESFIRRVGVLGKCSVSQISDLLEKVPLHEKICAFIAENPEHCVIATGNLYCWVDKLVRRIGCQAFCSEAVVQEDSVTKISSILKKESLVTLYRDRGDTVVFIGDGNNDMEAMRLADVAIAAGLIHFPAHSILTVADYAVYDEGALCRLLGQLL